MDKWTIAIAASIMFFKLSVNLEISSFCRNQTTTLGGEEFVCRNATGELFKNPDLYTDKTQKISCENCTLYTIDGITFNVTKNSLSFLSLTSSKIYTIKEFAFSKFRMLRVLYMRNNTISDLDPKSFMSLKRMAHLDLSHNNLRVLINNLFQELPNLNLLNLNFNVIYYIQPEAFRGLINLRHLYLSNNQIKKLDGFAFKYLPNLLLMYLENNQIVEMDSFSFANLSNLNSLYLNNNSIQYLTQYNFKPLTNLVDLQLRNNNLTEVQISAFNGLTNLKYLYLGNNHLKTVKRYGFVGLDNLQSLDLINNDFELFDLTYVDCMKNLNMLWLQQNRISNLNVDFKLDPLNSLHSLGLSDNNLTVLNYKLLYNKMPNIRDIFIYNNTWKCELLVAMFNFFQERNVSVCASLDCSVNATKQFVGDFCVDDELEEEDVDVGSVSEVGTSVRISITLIIFMPLLVFV